MAWHGEWSGVEWNGHVYRFGRFVGGGDEVMGVRCFGDCGDVMTVLSSIFDHQQQGRDRESK